MSGFPVARPGQSVGLLGGSFDPAHEGHVHVTREALRRLGLDRVWWLVSPGNPLKADGPAPLELRMNHAREMMEHPDVVVTDLEARLNTRFTADTLEALQTRYEGVRFVWLMGADNLAQFHLWRDWERIFGMVPIAVFARPGQGLQARTSPAARRFRPSLRPEHEARGLAAMQPPAWVFIDMPMHPASSTEIRDRGDWNHE